MADIINEGNSKVEVIDASTDALAKIIAELNGTLRVEQTNTSLNFYNPSIPNRLNQPIAVPIATGTPIIISAIIRNAHPTPLL